MELVGSLMAARVLETGIVLLMVFGRITCAGHVRVSLSPVCPTESVADSISGFRDFHCPVNGGDGSFDLVGVTEVGYNSSLFSLYYYFFLTIQGATDVLFSIFLPL